MMTRQMLLRGIARLVFISLFGLYCERINSFNQLGDCIYTRHEQQSHGTVNFASELGVEKDREGEKWIEKKTKQDDWLFGIPLVRRSATVGRDRQDARSSPSAETQKKRKR